jgi:hypothetical protein
MYTVLTEMHEDLKTSEDLSIKDNAKTILGK